jgi:hypothetical protein
MMREGRQEMKSKRFIIRSAAILLILALAVCMFIIGRGHTVYFDNKDFDHDGKSYGAYYKVTVIKDGEKVAKLSADDRGKCDLMGQTLSIVLEIMDEKGDKPHSHRVNMPIPYGTDGVVINVPALMAGLPGDAYMSEFVPIATPEKEAEEEEIVIDEFVMEKEE